MPIDSLTQAVIPASARANSSFTPVNRQLDRNSFAAVAKDAAQSGEKAVNIDEELRAVVNQLNNFIRGFRRDVEFSLDEQSGRSIVRVIESETGELVRQIPPEEVLAVSRLIADSLQVEGLLIQGTV